MIKVDAEAFAKTAARSLLFVVLQRFTQLNSGCQDHHLYGQFPVVPNVVKLVAQCACVCQRCSRAEVTGAMLACREADVLHGYMSSQV